MTRWMKHSFFSIVARHTRLADLQIFRSLTCLGLIIVHGDSPHHSFGREGTNGRYRFGIADVRTSGTTLCYIMDRT